MLLATRCAMLALATLAATSLQTAFAEFALNKQHSKEHHMNIYRLSGINRATKQHDEVNVSAHDLADAARVGAIASAASR